MAAPDKIWIFASADAFGGKSIGLFGGVMLLTNNLAGPTISLMPALVQQAGWLAIIVEMLVIAMLSVGCGFMLLDSIREIPGNSNFEYRVEFTDLFKFYLPSWLYPFSMASYVGYLLLTLMSYIIQTAQVMDYAIMNMFGCAYGVTLSPSPGVVCGTRTDSSTPFDSDAVVISTAFILVIVVCAPLSRLNLDDNIIFQIIGVLGFNVLVVIWAVYLVERPLFPTDVPMYTSEQGPLINTLLFNFAFTSALPSWLSEKKPEVSIAGSWAWTMLYIILVYSAVGIVGGLAYSPFYESDQNLFSKLNSSGSALQQATVQLYPVLQNLTSIPVFVIFIKYNLVQLGWFGNRAASSVSLGLPWLLSIPYYTGDGFQQISEIGGLFFSTIVNLLLPIIVFAVARTRKRRGVKVDCRCVAPAVDSAGKADPTGKLTVTKAGKRHRLPNPESVEISAPLLRRQHTPDGADGGPTVLLSNALWEQLMGHRWNNDWRFYVDVHVDSEFFDSSVCYS